MKKYIYFLILALFAFVFAYQPVEASGFSGTGSGTSADPYLIHNCADLQSVDSMNGGGIISGVIIWLANDIDCSDTANWSANGSGGFFGFAPLTNFRASFDGRGHAINNLYINRPAEDNVGLFDQPSNSALVNFKLVNLDITGREYVGGVAGFIYDSDVSGVDVTGNINGRNYVGGIAGSISNSGANSINRASFQGVAQSMNVGGGLVGYANNVWNISNSYSSSTVICQDSCGGLIGIASGSGLYRNIGSSYATGHVSTTAAYAGGLIGFMSNQAGLEIADSFAAVTAQTQGFPFRGGIIGLSTNSTVVVTNTFHDNFLMLALNCVATSTGGSVNVSGCDSFDSSLLTANDSPLTAWNFDSIWQTTIKFPVLRIVASDFFTVPGQVQNLDAEISNRNEAHVSWTAPASSGGLPLVRYEIEVKESSKTWSNWYYSNSNISTTGGSADVVDLKLGTNYDVRVRAWSNYGSGQWSQSSFTTGDPITIEVNDCSDLQSMPSDGGFREKFVLGADVDCTGVDFQPLYWESNAGFFQGTFDGQGHSISNLVINKPLVNSVGLFYGLKDGADIKNVVFPSGSITGASYVGGITAWAYDSIAISNIVSSLTVSGVDPNTIGNGFNVGGLVGYYQTNNDGGAITDNRILGEVDGAGKVGGLIGYFENFGTKNFSIDIVGNSVSENIGADTQLDGTYVGGLIGYLAWYPLDNATFFLSDNNVSASSTITGKNSVGGFFGFVEIYNSGSTHSLSLDLGPNNSVFSHVSSTDGDAGGLIGYLNDVEDGSSSTISIFQSFVSSDISSHDGDNMGGLVGRAVFSGSGTYLFAIADSYYSGSITGYGDLGGLVGRFAAENDPEAVLQINKSYVAGSINGNANYVGGLVGYADGSINITNSFSANVVSADDPGTIIGRYSTITGTSNFFDQAKNPAVQSAPGEDLAGFSPVNIGGISPAYFFNNSTNAPFNNGAAVWDFSSIWKTKAVTYPALRFYAEPPVYNVYVDDDFTSSSAGGHVWGTDAFDNIQNALDTVAVSGTIHVASGTYSSAITLQITTPRISLIGPGIGGESNAVIKNSACGDVFLINSSYVTIDGFKLEQRNALDNYCRDENSVIKISSTSVSTIIERNDIAGGGIGVSLESGSVTSTLVDNLFHNNNYGVVISGSLDNKIENNEIFANSMGIKIDCGGVNMEFCDSGRTEITLNNIHDNTGLAGIYFVAGDQVYSAFMIGPGNTITRNRDGINVESDARGLYIFGNQIFDNENLRSALSVANDSTGLYATENWWGDASGPLEASHNPSGAGGLISTVNSNYIFYRPFYTDSEMTTLSSVQAGPENLQSLVGAGTFILSFGEDASAVHHVEVGERTTLSFMSNNGTSTIVLPQGLRISRSDLELLDSTALGAGNVVPATLSGLGTNTVAKGAIQWGIPQLELTFSIPITINIFVGTDLNGQTLDIRRSSNTDGGWVNDGIVAPRTCVVSSGICTFQATKASYYVASQTTSSGGGSGGGGGGGGGGFATLAVNPSPFPGNYLGFKINNNEKETASASTTITLYGDPATVKWVAVSLDPAFSGASLQGYSKTLPFNLPEKFGTYKVYLKYYSTSGAQSEIFSKEITYKPVEIVPAQTVPTEMPVAKAAQLKPKYIFKRTLRVGSKGEDVKQLQKYLNSHGFVVAKKGVGSPGKETTLFGSATKAAVIKLQQANAKEILTPNKLKKGTGNVASATLKFLNKP